MHQQKLLDKNQFNFFFIDLERIRYISPISSSLSLTIVDDYLFVYFSSFCFDLRKTDDELNMNGLQFKSSV